MDKFCRAGQATDDSIIWRVRAACWITKATDTHSEYVIPLLHGNSGYANSPQCCVHTYITRLVITDMESVYCAVRTGSLNIIQVNRGLLNCLRGL